MERYSVLMSVYYKEQAACLREAIDSILQQTVPPSDFVLVCDGPLTEPLEQVIDKYAGDAPELFQIVRLPENRGLGAALNEGLARCKYELVARMDSDDISVPDRMEKQLPVMVARPELSALGGNIAEFTQSPHQVLDYRVVPQLAADIRREAAFRNPMNHVTTLLRKEDIRAVGGYRSILGFEDYDLWARLLTSGKTLENLNETLCYVRVADAMYMRRGGLDYFRNTVRLEKELLSLGIVTKLQYARNVTVRFAGTVLIPNHLRSVLFQHLMRKKRTSDI